MDTAKKIRAPQQLSIGVFAGMLVGFLFFLLALNGFDWSAIGDVTHTVEGKKSIVNNLSRTAVTLISTVFACLFLAIPLTANMYTPQLISIFVSSWTNRFALAFYVFSAAYTLSLSRIASDVYVPAWQFGIAQVLVLMSLALLLPYLFSVFRFLNPHTIMARVADQVFRAMEPGGPSSIATRQEQISRRIRQLGNIVLKSLERGDREVAIAAVEALDACAERYLHLKNRHSPEWFEVPINRFPGLSRAALTLVRDDKIWVEMELQSQLGRAYSGALARIPDVISAISRTQRHFALAAAEEGDRGALELSLRHFNNFLREAVKRRDIHAIYDLLYQYRTLGQELWGARPERVVEIARHLDYYGRIARAQGQPFAQDLVAYDLGHVLAEVDAQPEDVWNSLVGAFLEIGAPGPGEAPSAGVFKARLVTAAKVREKGRVAAADRIMASLENVGPDLLDVAERDVMAKTSPWFWEVTDRMRDLDYLPENERRHVRAALDKMRHAAN